MQKPVALLWAAIVLTGASAPTSRADVPADDWADHPGGRDRAAVRADDDAPTAEFSLGLGYSRINFTGSPPLIDGRDCVHVEPILSIAPFAAVPPLRLGAAVGWSVAVDDTRGAVIANDGGPIWASNSDVAFMLFEPELRLSWRQPFGPDGFYFIEPGVAAGAAIGWLDVAGAALPGSSGNGDFTETDASFEWKVFLRAGLPFSNGLAGVEASYMSAGRMEFADDIRGEPNELYVGIFGSLQF
jgi:hypothetical protein